MGTRGTEFLVDGEWVSRAKANDRMMRRGLERIAALQQERDPIIDASLLTQAITIAADTLGFVGDSECPACHEHGANGHYDGRKVCQAIAGTFSTDACGVRGCPRLADGWHYPVSGEASVRMCTEHLAAPATLAKGRSAADVGQTDGGDS